MKYSLRSLMAVGAIAPPAIAGGYRIFLGSVPAAVLIVIGIVAAFFLEAARRIDAPRLARGEFHLQPRMETEIFTRCRLVHPGGVSPSTSA